MLPNYPDSSKPEPFRIRRDMLKTSPNRVTALWLLGIFILVSTVFVGVAIGHAIFGSFNDIMAYWFGFFFTLLIGSIVGWFTIVLQDNAQDIQIKVVQQK